MSPQLLKKCDHKQEEKQTEENKIRSCAMSTVKLSWEEIGLSIDVRSAVGVT